VLSASHRALPRRRNRPDFRADLGIGSHSRGDEEPLEVPSALAFIGRFAGQAAHISVRESAISAAGVDDVAVAARRQPCAVYGSVAVVLKEVVLDVPSRAGGLWAGGGGRSAIFRCGRGRRSGWMCRVRLVWSARAWPGEPRVGYGRRVLLPFMIFLLVAEMSVGSGVRHAVLACALPSIMRWRCRAFGMQAAQPGDRPEQREQDPLHGPGWACDSDLVGECGD
jgi:hypothetical protein